MSVKELCGLPPIASLKQCLLTLSSRLITSDSVPSVSLVMKDSFPYLEPLGAIPDVQKRMLAAYDLVSGRNFPFLLCIEISKSRPFWVGFQCLEHGDGLYNVFGGGCQSLPFGMCQAPVRPLRTWQMEQSLL